MYICEQNLIFLFNTMEKDIYVPTEKMNKVPYPFL